MKPVKIVIPQTIEEATSRLAGIDALLTATEWQKAAIVYAFTRDGGQGPRGQNPSTGVLSSERFAALGIQGLKSGQTVREYRGYWKEAIEKGEAHHIEPGDEVDLPTSDFPPTPRPSATSRLAGTPEERASEIRKHLADPEVLEVLAPTIVDMVGRDPALTIKVLRVNEEYHPAPIKKLKVPTGWDWIIGMGVGSEVIVALQRTREEVMTLTRYLELHWKDMDPQGRAVVQEILDDYDRIREMATEYQDLIRQSIGQDPQVIGRRILDGMEGNR